MTDRYCCDGLCMQGRNCPCTAPPAAPTFFDRAMIAAALAIGAAGMVAVLVYYAARALGVEA